MSDIFVLVVIVALPAAALLGPLAILTLGTPADGTRQPAPGSSSSARPADGSATVGPAARMSSVTPSA